eukprot:scaffold509_cov315-Pavlova_lutheri.AAC.3
MSCHLLDTVQPPQAHPSQLWIGTGSVGSLRSVSIKVPGSPYKKPVLIGGDRASMRPGETSSGSGTILSLYSKGISDPLLDG